MLYGSVDNFGCPWLSIHKTSHIPMVQSSMYFKMRGESWCVATFSFCLQLALTEGWRHLLVKSRAETESLIHVRLCRHRLKFLPGEVQLLPTQTWNCDCWFVPCKPQCSEIELPSDIMCSSESSGRNGISHQLCQCFYREWIRYFCSRRTLNTCFGVASHCHPLRPLSQCGQSMQKNWIFTVILVCYYIFANARDLSVHGISELIIVTSFPNATGHTPLASFSRLLTQLKITSSAPLFLLHLSCKTHSHHIIGRQETWGAFQDWAEDVFDAVSLTCFSLSLICETP